MTTTPEDFNRYQLANGGLSPTRITELVRSFQETHGLVADGKAGITQTIPAIDAAIARRRGIGLSGSPAELDAMLAAAGRAAVAEARRYLALDIIDPAPGDTTPNGVRCRKQIDEMLQRCQLPHRVPYAGNGKGPQWCGIFAAACWYAAGVDPNALAAFWPSTIRLLTWVNYRPWDADHPNPRPSTGPYRLVVNLDKVAAGEALPFEPREGDILLVGDGDPDAGDHVTVVTGCDAATRTFTTIAGNGVIVDANGKRREGVVESRFAIGAKPPRYRAMWLLRLAPRDITRAR